MSRNADGLQVTYDGLDTAATTIGNEAKALEQDLDELRRMVVQSQEYWAGEAQSTFHQKLQRWDKEANDIHQALTGIGHVVHQAGGDYMEGDKKAASFFQ
ncbi:MULTISPECIES: WXG100 family type VII secretion target [unclassified Streptomyces]|uniref:WXG100 family type VII secretion target n=1 Tax=unclassified Streptomyces TaxID=2593676 RepID=UPI001F038C5A|nr:MULTISPECIES: WXG100 family type VII secretion target [unclassified Streptomyces]MCH0567279.1 WXG100 family type VII secretion target [Streptomyces sp. MUM 2J]MCH0572952.1 WXG100 family type VII secretion target [Streptomyces sp. MUM 136J]